MTVKLLAAYGIYPENAIVTLNTHTEEGLIAAFLAEEDTTGGVEYVAPVEPNQVKLCYMVVSPSNVLLGLLDTDGETIVALDGAATLAAAMATEYADDAAAAAGGVAVGGVYHTAGVVHVRVA